MFKFKNENVKKEAKKKTINLVIWTIILLISIGILICCVAEDEEENENRTYINNIILKEDNEDKKAEVKVATIPYVFATIDETDDKYYLITDGEFLYIVYLTPEQFEELNKEDIDTKPITIQGVTKKISSDVLQYALEAYNEPLPDERKIAEEDAEGYFGDIYLDATIEFTETNNMYFLLGIMLGTLGMIGFVVSLIVKIKFNVSINKISEDDASILDDEMNNQSAFYYSKTHMYLTENYIINLKNKLQVIPYKDVVWMYEYVQRVNFVKTSKSIIIMTKDGKKHTIATINLITKAKKEVFDEIWQTISSKNAEIKLGFTQENIKEIKETYGKKKNKKELL